MAKPQRSRKILKPLKGKRPTYTDEFVFGLNYKGASQLKRFVTDRGKILSRRNSGLSAKQQRHVAEQVKLARYMALLHYTADHLRNSQNA
ncbi:MAG: 30S ribosomal protein S18 [Armatimonadetes bacterium]|nr:30S ribosomal protein S18 [Armatimonadota bacterium]